MGSGKASGHGWDALVFGLAVCIHACLETAVTKWKCIYYGHVRMSFLEITLNFNVLIK